MAIVRFDTLRTKAFGTITNSYTTLGSALDRNWRIFRIINDTDADLLISADGTNDNFFIPAGSFVLYDLATNALNVQDSDWFVMQIGTQFYAKYASSAPTSGSAYIEGTYSAGV
jgi:hypothetical protein